MKVHDSFNLPDDSGDDEWPNQVVSKDYLSTLCP